MSWQWAQAVTSMVLLLLIVLVKNVMLISWSATELANAGEAETFGYTSRKGDRGVHKCTQVCTQLFDHELFIKLEPWKLSSLLTCIVHQSILLMSDFLDSWVKQHSYGTTS